MSFELYEKINNKFIPTMLTPFPKKRCRDKTIRYLNKYFKGKGALKLPIIAWSAVLMNSFYTQNRLVCAVTRKSLSDICEQAGLKFKDKNWTDFIRIICGADSFECIPGEFVGQPSIFIIKDITVLEGLKNRNPDIDLEKMRSEQLAEVQAFVSKAKEIKKPISTRNRY